MADDQDIVEIIRGALLVPNRNGVTAQFLAEAVLSALTAAGVELVRWRKEPLPDEIDCDGEYYVGQWPPLAAEPDYYCILRGPQEPGEKGE